MMLPSPNTSFKKATLALMAIGLMASNLTLVPLAMAEAGSPQPRPSFGGDQPPPPPMRDEDLIEKLKLSPAQSQKFKEIREGAKAKAEPLKQQLRAKRTELMQYLFSAQANQGKALTLQKQMEQLQSQLGDLRLQTLFQMRGILTPEQLQQFIQLHQQRQAQHPFNRKHPEPHD